MNLDEITSQIMADERNRSYTERGIPPIFQIHEKAKILLIGQAPGKKVEQSLIPFHDQSGNTLMQWMGIDPETFYSDQIAIMPMDFYYPGKGKTGDLPPRAFGTGVSRKAAPADARHTGHHSDRKLFHPVLSGKVCEAEPDRDCAELCRISAGLLSDCASESSERPLAEKQSLVLRGSGPGASENCE